MFVHDVWSGQPILFNTRYYVTRWIKLVASPCVCACVCAACGVHCVSAADRGWFRKLQGERAKSLGFDQPTTSVKNKAKTLLQPKTAMAVERPICGQNWDNIACVETLHCQRVCVFAVLPECSRFAPYGCVCVQPWINTIEPCPHHTDVHTWTVHAKKHRKRSDLGLFLVFLWHPSTSVAGC